MVTVEKWNELTNGSGNSGPILSPGIKVWPWAVWQQLLSYIPNHTELHLRNNSLSCEVMSQPCAFQVLSRMCLGPNGSMKWGHWHKVFCCFILIFQFFFKWNELTKYFLLPGSRFTKHAYIYKLKSLVNFYDIMPANTRGNLIYELICGI